MKIQVVIALIAGIAVGALLGAMQIDAPGGAWMGGALGAAAGLPIGVNWAARTTAKRKRETKDRTE